MDVAAGAVGVTSLAFQALAGCIKGFVLLSTAHDFVKDGTTLMCMLELEELRLVEWAKHSGLLGEDRALDPRLNQSRIEKALETLEKLLNDTQALGDRYKLRLVAKSLKSSDSLSDASENTQVDSTAADGLIGRLISDDTRRDILWHASLVHSKNRFPKRMWWAAVDKQKLESFLNTIHGMIQDLWDILDILRQDEVLLGVGQTLTRVVRLEDKNDQLIMLSDALIATDASSTNGNPTITDLASATSVKALSVEIGDAHNKNSTQISAQRPRSPPAALQMKLLERRPPEVPGNATQSGAKEREVGIYAGEPVYLEWKLINQRLKSKLASRIQNLAALLKSPMSNTFLAMNCIGTLEDNDPPRVAFVFRHPCAQRLQEPISLRQVMGQTYSLQPSVSERLQLAIKVVRAVQLLNLAGWYHKDLRSDNVLFFPARSVFSYGKDSIPFETLLGQPYLGGFAFARESKPCQISEQPSSDPSRDIYRHPDAMGEPSLDFDESKDDYSLGIVLMEIARWTPLKAILQAEHVVDFKKEQIPLTDLAIQPHLLNENKGGNLEKVAFRMGNVYRKVVKKYLHGLPTSERDTIVQELQACRM